MNGFGLRVSSEKTAPAPLFLFFQRFKRDSALYSFFLHRAGQPVRLLHIAFILKTVSITAARTIKPRPAFRTPVFTVNMRFSEIILYFIIYRPVKNIPHFPLFHAHKLVTGINLPVGSYRHIFVSAATASQSFDSAGTLIQIDFKMEVRRKERCINMKQRKHENL